MSPEQALCPEHPAPAGWLRALARNSRPRPLIIAHRGDSCRAPENTREAARRGRDSGADAWELDVHLTRDGVPVVIHDASLLRTTDVSTRFAGDPRSARGFAVADFDLDEVRILDAGSWFLDPAGPPRSAADFGTLSLLEETERACFASGTVRVPTLAEALALTEELDWLVNVELKSFPNRNPHLLDAVLDVIATTGSGGRVLISSFDHTHVAHCVRHPSDLHLPTGVLAATPLHRPERYVRDEVGAIAYHPSAQVLGAASDAYLRAPGPHTLRHDEIAALTANGVPVLVYTVNDTAPDGLAAHLAAAGVDGIFSDHPGGLVRLFHALGEHHEPIFPLGPIPLPTGALLDQPAWNSMNQVEHRLRSHAENNALLPFRGASFADRRVSIIIGIMGYSEKLQRLCILRGIDQATLASQLGLSKSSISRILSGVQEPKLLLANELAKALGVTLDYLVEESAEIGPTQHLVMLTEEELMILKMVRRLGSGGAIDRLLNVAPASHAADLRGGAASVAAVRGRSELSRFDPAGEDLSDA